MWTFHTQALYDSGPDAFLTPSNMDFLWGLADVLDLVIVAVIVVNVASKICIDELRPITLYTWNTLIKGDCMIEGSTSSSKQTMSVHLKPRMTCKGLALIVS